MVPVALPAARALAIVPGMRLVRVSILGLAAACGQDPNATEDCEVATDAATGEAATCAKTDQLVYACTTRDGWECWYQTGGERYYVDGDCGDPRDWEPSGDALAAACGG